MTHERQQATLRPMEPGDLEAVGRLLGQLGYALEADEVARRFAAVTAAEGHRVLVAEQAGRVVGLLHVFARPALEKPPEAVVQALVVDDAARGAGLGRLLMQAAERWAAEQGFASVALGTHVAREDAKAFYARLGYAPTATAELLRKML